RIGDRLERLLTRHPDEARPRRREAPDLRTEAEGDDPRANEGVDRSGGGSKRSRDRNPLLRGFQTIGSSVWAGSSIPTASAWMATKSSTRSSPM
ncbi:MAG: hypothetical protein CMJ52_04195, partial [Planctomycetaceae bacterium]|nr:hypothetical protein [Planctomycetaceae bacterium]